MTKYFSEVTPELGEPDEPGKVSPAAVLPESALITFTSSGIQTEWTNHSDTLLEAAILKLRR